MALCWASRPGRLDVVRPSVCCRCEYSARPRLWRRISFSGLGGTGGAGRFVDDSEGTASTSGASRRSGGGGGLGFGCCGACCGYCCH